jgi:glucan 1,3-beta-glucosidase
LTFNGGAIGLSLSGQQWVLKNIATNGATTGISVGAFDLVCHSCHFSNGATGIDATGVSGSVTMIDSSANSVGNFLDANSNSNSGNAIVLDGITMTNSGNTVVVGGNVVLTGNVAAGTPWVKGSVVREIPNFVYYNTNIFVVLVRRRL